MLMRGRITGMVALGIMAAGGAWARARENPDITVCVFGPQDFVMTRAQDIAGQIFAEAGVHVAWRNHGPCPFGGLVITFRLDTPSQKFPGALAYALPYEGAHIEIFNDRVRQTVEPGRVPALMAHVLAHEIAHVLQGIARHSETGIMKANWDEKDYREMAFQPLGFTALDLQLIHLGLGARKNREMATNSR